MMTEKVEGILKFFVGGLLTDEEISKACTPLKDKFVIEIKTKMPEYSFKSICDTSKPNTGTV